MRLGEIEFYILNNGTFRLDGGAMFGVIPKPMWERLAPADEKNRITLSMNSLLIRAEGKWILVETGAGDKYDAKRRDIYAFEGAPRLPGQIAAHGLGPEQIDIVVNTHLHFDHCGWNTRIVDGVAVPTFPNAKYYVHLGEFEHARHPTERDRASYFPENFEPMVKTGQWHLVEGQGGEVVSGVELFVLPGHTQQHDGRAAFFRKPDGDFPGRSGAYHGASAVAVDHGLRSLSHDHARREKEVAAADRARRLARALLP